MRKTAAAKQERALRELRRAVRDFLVSIPARRPPRPIVEVGRMLAEGKVYEEYREFYVDTARLLSPAKLVRLDIDPSVKPDICDDVVNIDRHFKPGSVGTVLLIHVLEHVAEFWRLPAKLAKVLRPGGLVFIQTPWNFRFHGPRPDCWRISDDGYAALFKKDFEIVSLDKVNPLKDHLHPLVINVVLRRK